MSDETDAPPVRRHYSRGPSHLIPPQVRRPALPRLLRLWSGDRSGYPSDSEADLDLLGILARYCEGDPATLDKWFRGSGRMRPEWDEPYEYDPTATYGQVLIKAAAALPASELVTALASDIAPTAVDWLWPGFVAFGTLTVVEGDPGLGKSTVVLDLAARLTNGRPMPGADAACPPAGVLVASCEDSAAHTTVPRLVAAGADRSKVRLLLESKEAHGTVRGLRLPDDLPRVEAQMTADGARLLVIDPLMAVLGQDRRGRRIDAHRDQSIRVLLGAFKEMAERTGAAVVVVRHLTKQAGRAAVYRGGGSIGITAAARGVLLATQHPHDPDRRVLAVVKSNLGLRPPGRTYALTGAGASTAVTWGEACSVGADDLLDGPAATGLPAWRHAAEWLAKELAGGPRMAAEVLAAAAERGWTPRQVARAKRRVGVVSEKAEGGWVWQLA